MAFLSKVSLKQTYNIEIIFIDELKFFNGNEK